MAIMTYEFLENLMATKEGVSVNGSEGLGGHAQGFDIQNGGVTRRAPGEGPKVNGGRAQSQEMDSYDQPQYIDEEMPWMGANDPQGWDQQIATGNTSGGTPVTDENFDLAEMFGMDEAQVKHMKKAIADMERTRDQLRKSSEKEKKEHPWATKKQAMQIAKDHEKLGESLKRTFLFKEGPVKYIAGADPMNLNDPDGGGKAIANPFDNRQEPNLSPTRKTSKPSIEDAHGEYVVVSQFHDQVFKGKNLDEIPEPAWKAANAYISREPSDQPGYVSYLVGEDGELELHSANWDSSD